MSLNLISLSIDTANSFSDDKAKDRFRGGGFKIGRTAEQFRTESFNERASSPSKLVRQSDKEEVP